MRQILVIIFSVIAFNGYSQIGNDLGGISGVKKGGVLAPPIIGGFKAIGTEMKPMEQKIEHVAPDINNCFSISSEGRQEVSGEIVDSTGAESRSFMFDIKSEYDAAGADMARSYYGKIKVVSVTVYDEFTRVVLDAEDFVTADWFIISKASVLIDSDSRKPYFIKDIENSLMLEKTFALNLTRNSHKRISLIFPKIDSWVTTVDLICPMPDGDEIHYINSKGEL